MFPDVSSIQELFTLQTMYEEALLYTHMLVFVMMHSDELTSEF